MSKKIVLLLAVMTILAIPAFGDGTITANVSLNGTAYGGAYVAVRTAPQALADAENGYGTTNGSGVYTTGTLVDGTYYVQAWINGYIAVESSATISGDTPSVSLNITETVQQQLIQTTGVPASSPHRYFGGGDPSDGTSPDFINLDPPGGTTFIDGVYGSTTNSGGGGCTKVHMGVDLADDHWVNQVIVAWYNDGNHWPAYQIQYATGSVIPGINDPAWTTWASGRSVNMNRPMNVSAKGGWTSVITAPSVSARFWRILTTTMDHLYIREFQVESTEAYEPPPTPGTIMGVVTAAVGGAPIDNAVIGIKDASASSATADADYYYTTIGGGKYVTDILPNGDYLVGVWADGYKMSETTVTVDSLMTSEQNFSLDAQDPNVAQGKPVSGGVFDADGNWLPVSGTQVYGGGGGLVNGVRNAGYNEAGDFRVASGSGPIDASVGVDLGADYEVSQALVDWFYDGAPYWPRGGYKIEFATAAAPTAWSTFYEFTGAGQPKAFGGTAQNYEAISGAPSVGRYWRISSTDGYGWGHAVFCVQEFEVYSATTLPVSIAGTITVNGGVPATTAVIGVKSTENALADATYNFSAEADGTYDTGIIPEGDYYVAVWVDGFKVVETGPVTVVSTATQPVSFDLTVAQDANVAAGKSCSSTEGFWFGDAGGHFVNVSDGTQTAGTFVNGVRDVSYNWVGYAGSGYGPIVSAPTWMAVDLGADHEVGQVMVDWSQNGMIIYMPKNGYKIQCATAAAPTVWTDWYTYTGLNPKPAGAGSYELITGAPTTARYWRIYAEQGYSWGYEDNPEFCVSEFEVYSATVPPPPSISIAGTVTVNGAVPATIAVIGVKTTSNAMADPNYYFLAEADGTYNTGVLPEGDYYVGVWVDGFKTSETGPVTVVSTSTQIVDVDLTEAQDPNVAVGRPCSSTEGHWFGDAGGHFINITDSTQVADTIVDGSRDSGSNWVGYAGSGYGPIVSEPTWMAVDLGGDCEVSQVLVDWFQMAIYMPKNGYKIQCATAAAPTTWIDWYTYTGLNPKPFGDGGYEVIIGAPVSARYWRIYAEQGYSWGYEDNPEFVLEQFEVYSTTVPPPPAPAIAGTVTVNGAVPATTAVIGVKTTSNALADANYYFSALADGTYDTGVLPAGDYYVGVWVDGFKTMETGPVTVVASTTQPVSFDLTETQDPNVAMGSLGFGGVWYADDVFYEVNFDQPEPFNHAGSGGALLNGNRAGGYSIVGDFRVASGGGPIDASAGVDLGIDSSVSQVLIDWYYDGANYWPKGGYKVQYATAAAPTTWNDFYEYVGENPTARGGNSQTYEVISGGPATGRYWRISATDGHGWGFATFGVQEFEVYSSTPAPGISYFKGLPDSTTVGIYGKPVTLTPMLGGGPTGDFFYIEEPDRSAAIRVVDYTGTGNPLPEPGDMVSVKGTIETDDGSGGTFERFISADTIVISSATENVAPLGTNTRAINEDTKLAAMLVRTSGVIRELDSDSNYQWFKIADGYSKDGAEVWTKVGVPGYYGDPSLANKIALGDYVKLTGTVSQENASTKLILLRNISFAGPAMRTPAHSWTEDFESYTTGSSIVGQGGWSLYADIDHYHDAPWTSPGQVGGASATVVVSPDPVEGSKSLKLNAPNAVGDPLVSDSIAIHKLTTPDDLQFMIIKFDVFRPAGTVTVPQGPDPNIPGGTYPSTFTNNLAWWSYDQYQWYDLGMQHDLSNNTWPWTGGFTTIQGQWTKIVLYIDYVNHTRSSWYNDTLTDDRVPDVVTGTDLKWSDIVFHYYNTLPFVADLNAGRPAYLDNIYAGWSTTSDP